MVSHIPLIICFSQSFHPLHNVAEDLGGDGLLDLFLPFLQAPDPYLSLYIVFIKARAANRCAACGLPVRQHLPFRTRVHHIIQRGIVTRRL